MVKLLANLKKHMSTVRKDAWHARLAKYALGKYAYRTDKACPYWWLVVPSSLPVAGLKLLGYGILCAFIWAVWVLYLVIGVIGYFFGRRPRKWLFHHAVDTSFGRTFLGYKQKPGGGKKRFAPYQFGLPALLVAAVVILVVSNGDEAADFLSDSYQWVLGFAGAVIVLYIMGMIYGRFVGPLMRRKYQQWCPEITWVEPEKPQGEDTRELVDA